MTSDSLDALARSLLFAPDPARRSVARDLTRRSKMLPIVSPHGHVPPGAAGRSQRAALARRPTCSSSPITTSSACSTARACALEDLGVPTRDGTPVETDHRRIWQRFAEHFHLFRGTPTGLWLADELINVFGVEERLNGDERPADLRPPGGAAGPPGVHAARAVRALQHRRCSAPPTPRPTRWTHHRRLRADGLRYIRPTFRPDAVVNIASPAGASRSRAERRVGHRRHRLRQLYPGAGAAAGGLQGAGRAGHRPWRADPVHRAPERRARPTAIFERALRGQATTDDAARFTGHMLIEFARMSAEDGLVMQLHVGSLRDHNAALFARFGPDKGADIPVATEWTRNLRPLLNAYGNDPRFRLILFTLDESTYSRELAPLAGHYPAAAARPALVVLRQCQRHAPLLRRAWSKRPGCTTRPASTTTRAPLPRSRRATTSGGG